MVHESRKLNCSRFVIDSTELFQHLWLCDLRDQSVWILESKVLTQIREILIATIDGRGDVSSNVYVKVKIL